MSIPKTSQIFYWALNTDILQGCVRAITRTRSNKVDEELQKEVRQVTNEISSIIVERLPEIQQAILRAG
jgi:hypothetical protein